MFPSLCFYSTYEELKLINVNGFASVLTEFLQYLWGIETSLLLLSFKSLPSFYSTYEELKLVNSRGTAYFGVVFLQYLWGIETRRAM